MWLISHIFFSLFISCISFDVIPLSNFMQKNIKFSKGDYYVFSYKNEGGINSEVAIILKQIGSGYHTLGVYIYLDKSSITQKSDKFINYYKSLTDYIGFYNLITDEKLTGTFYIVISEEDNRATEGYFILKIHESGAPPFNIPKNIFYDYFKISSTNNLTYIFHMRVNNHKYLRYDIQQFRYIGSSITIYDSNNNMIFRNPEKESFKGYIELENNNSYLKIYIKLAKYDSRSYFHFFMSISDYYNIIPLDIDTENFQLFPSFSYLNLLLDTSSLDKSYRIKVEFSHSGSSNLNVKILGYESDEPKIIQNTTGKNLSQMDYKSLRSKGEPDYFYILQDNNLFKRVILKIALNYGYDKFIIRYGEKEFYYGKNVLASCMFGIGLSIPNIFMQLFRKSLKQHIAPWYSLTMNILLHFAYGNLFAKPFHIGGNNSLIIGIVFFALYIIILLCFTCFACDEKQKNKTIFNQLYHSSKEFEELRILEDLINDNRKLPPKILIKATAEHDESREVLKEFEPYQQAVYANDFHVWSDGHISNFRHFDHFAINYDHVNNYYSEWKRVDEGGGKISGKQGKGDSINKFVKDKEIKTVETWNETIEYKYISWKDDSKIFKLTPDKSILNVKFDYKLIFNISGIEGKKRTIDELCTKGKKIDTTVHYKEYYSCDKMVFKGRCYVNREEYMRIKEANKKKYLYIGIVLFILGYSSIMDCLFYFEEGDNDTFIIEKLISDEDDCSAQYMEEDKNLQLIRYENLKKEEIKFERDWKLHNGKDGNKYTDPLLYS